MGPTHRGSEALRAEAPRVVLRDPPARPVGLMILDIRSQVTAKATKLTMNTKIIDVTSRPVCPCWVAGETGGLRRLRGWTALLRGPTTRSLAVGCRSSKPS